MEADAALRECKLFRLDSKLPGPLRRSVADLALCLSPGFGERPYCMKEIPMDEMGYPARNITVKFSEMSHRAPPFITPVTVERS